MSKLQTALNLANLSLAAILLSGLAGHVPAPTATAPLVTCDCSPMAGYSVVSPKRAHKARHKRVDGLALIRRFEGLRLTAYPDPVTHGAPWTICYGRTGPMVHKGLTVSRGQCEAWLKADYAKAKRAARAISPDLTHNEIEALASLAHNIGANALAGSTLAKRLKAGDKQGAAHEILKWSYVGQTYVASLFQRRTVEMQAFVL